MRPAEANDCFHVLARSQRIPQRPRAKVDSSGWVRRIGRAMERQGLLRTEAENISHWNPSVAASCSRCRGCQAAMSFSKVEAATWPSQYGFKWVALKTVGHLGCWEAGKLARYQRRGGCGCQRPTSRVRQHTAYADIGGLIPSPPGIETRRVETVCGPPELRSLLAWDRSLAPVRGDSNQT